MARLVLLLLACSAVHVQAATRVRDVVYDARGARANGTLFLEWPSFTTAGGKAVAGSRQTYRISNGVLDIVLEPTIGASPAVAYTARFSLAGGTGMAIETWAVPDSALPVTLATIRVVGGTGSSLGTPAGGDVSGLWQSLQVVGLRGTPLAATAPTAGQAIVFDGTRYAPSTVASSAGAEYPGELRCDVVRTSAATLTIFEGATASRPCVLGFGAHRLVVTAAATVTLSGAETSGTVYIYATPDGLVADESTVADIACDAGCTTAATGGFPVRALPIAEARFTATQWDAGVLDRRAFQATKPVQCGTGLICQHVQGTTTVGADTIELMTKAAHQAGQALVCAAGSGTDAYTCAMTPTLHGYATGMVVELIPDVASAGAASLTVGALATVAIKQADGVTDPADGALAAGVQTPLRYDGTVFRLPAAAAASGGGGGDVAVAAGAYASLPVCTAGVNQLYRSPFYTSYCTSGTWTHWTDLAARAAVIPPTTGWTNINDTGVTYTAMAQGPLLMEFASGGASGLQRGQVRTKPAGSTWTLTAQIEILPGYAQRCGLIATDGTGSTANFAFGGYQPSTGERVYGTGSDLNADGTQYGMLYSPLSNRYWVRLRYTSGGWSYWEWSLNGVTWSDGYNDNTGFYISDVDVAHVGWYGRKGSTYYKGACTLLSWSVE